MKKHLIAVAVAAAVAAPAAMADTTLYGLAHASVDYISVDGAAGSDESNVGVSSNSSRLGVKGSEKLGNGLTAVYQFETQLDISSNEGASSGLFTTARNTFVGLSSGFGTVLVGKHDTPMKLVGRQYDLFGDTVGDSRNIIAVKDGLSDPVSTKITGFDLRPNNVIAYVSPEMAGFQAIAAYVTDHDFVGVGDSNDSKFDLNDFDAVSVSLGYKAKMFDVAAAYEAHNIDGDVATSVGLEDTESAYRIGAGVNFAGFRVNALYQQTSDAGFVSGLDRAVWGLGGQYTFGKNAVKAQYYVADESDNSTDNGASMWAVGYDYNMSKQTTLYAAYALTSNDDNTKSFTATGGGHGDNPSVGINGGDSSAFSLGVKHKF